MHTVPQNKDEFTINNLFYCCKALTFTHSLAYGIGKQKSTFWKKFLNIPYDYVNKAEPTTCTNPIKRSW